MRFRTARSIRMGSLRNREHGGQAVTSSEDYKQGKQKPPQLWTIFGFDCPAATAAARTCKQRIKSDSEAPSLSDGCQKRSIPRPNFRSFQMTPVEAPRSTDSFLFFDCRDVGFFFHPHLAGGRSGGGERFRTISWREISQWHSNSIPAVANKSITATGHHWSYQHIPTHPNTMEKQSRERPNLLLLLSLQLLSQLGLHDALLFLPLCHIRHMSHDALWRQSGKKRDFVL